MDMCEYIEQAASQIRARRARDMVARELRAHIEDQEAYCLERGMSGEEAEEEAVRQMGDPVEVGIAMDRIHRPQTDWKMIVMLMFLCVLGLCLQVALNREFVRMELLEAGTEISLYLFSGVSRGLAASLFIAVALGVLVCLMDYTVVLRYAAWFAGCALLLLLMLIERVVILPNFSGPGPFPENWIYLLVPLYAIWLYRQRGRGGRGFASGIILLFLLWGSLRIASVLLPVTWIASLRFGFVLAVMLSTALVCGWYGDKVRGRLLCLWGGGLMAFALAVLYMLWHGGFRAQRIRAVLHPFDYSGGAGYYAVMIRGWLGRCTLWGEPEAAQQFLQNYMGGFYATGGFYRPDDGNILYLFLCYGILPGAAVCLIFLGCIGYFLYKCLRQKNQFGRVTGCGCCLAFLAEFIGYLMSNFGILPSHAALPFLSYSGMDIEVWAVLMGLVFSIIRYQNLLPAEHTDKIKKYRYRLRIEKVAR